MKLQNTYTAFLFLLVLSFGLLGFKSNKVTGEVPFPTSSSSNSGCPQIHTDCAFQIPGCKSSFGTYDPTVCKCICPDSLGSDSLNRNFSGIWKARITGNIDQSTSSSGECIVCAQVIPKCSGDEIIIPQSCTECSHCATANTSGNLNCTLDGDCPLGTCQNGNTFKSYSCSEDGKCTQIFYFADPCEFSPNSSGTIAQRNIDHSQSNILKTLTLRLCVKDGSLGGTIEQGNSFKGKIISQEIISQEIISGNEVLVTVEDKDNKTLTITLKLTGKRNMLITFENADSFKARKLSLSKNCNFNTSSMDCTPKGSCRGEDGVELPCPEGTQCSGLPAYGCYPPNCPVPICCSPDTMIRTTGIQKRIADIKEGELILSNDEKPTKVIKITKTEVKNHKIVKVKLNDATVLEISPGHPTADGRSFKDLKMGDILDGRIVVEAKLTPYKYKYTYDILPDSKTGNYYANGVLIGSTLK